MERLSGQDSGISRDMSEFSHRGKGNKGITTGLDK